MSELIHSALPFPLEPRGGRRCSHAVDGEGLAVTFGRIAFAEGAPKDLRDGS